MNHSEIVSFLWGVADLIRDTFGDIRLVGKNGKEEDVVVSRIFPRPTSDSARSR
jgi:hypothetical protein